MKNTEDVNPDWKAFLDAVPWFLESGQKPIVSPSRDAGAWGPRTADLALTFPHLTNILTRARTAAVTIESREFVLFAWTTHKGIISWLSPRPTSRPSSAIHPVHRTLIRSFGGIVERGNEPPNTWLLNHNDVLTAEQARQDASFIEDYSWAFEDAGLEVPIDLAAFYPIAREANGNCTICHRVSGEVLLFAPDHNFRHVRPYLNCPEYTLYTLHGATDIVSWIETIAGQWEASVPGPPNNALQRTRFARR